MANTKLLALLEKTVTIGIIACRMMFPPKFKVLPTRKGAAFSLIELLVVLIIVAILAVFVVPAIPSLLGARGLGRSVDEASGLLELARTEALSRRTYVYVAMQNTNFQGSAQVWMGAVASLDGTTSMVTNNLRALGRVLKLDSVSRSDVAPAAVAARAGTFVPPSVTLPPFKVGSVEFAAPTGVIFSPNGELLQTNTSITFLPKVDIGFVPMKGTTALTTDGAVVRISGSSGKIQVIRP